MLRKSCLIVACAHLFACGGGGSPLDAAVPKIKSTGAAQNVYAGQVTTANFDAERILGPASQGRPGDYFLRNSKVRMIIQAPGQNIGPCPFGGNLIDFDRVANPAGDQLGEISPFFQLGRTFNFDSAEVVADGSKGGPAALRFHGHDAKIDYIDLRNLGSFAAIIPDEIDAKVKLGIEAAVTYILDPDATTLRVVYSIYNPTKVNVSTSWGALSDTGGSIEVFHPYTGFGELGVTDILGGDSGPPTTYAVFQGVGIAYGIMPVYESLDAGGTGLAIAGVSVELFDIAKRIDAFGVAGQTLDIPSGKVITRETHILVADDVAGISAQVHAARNEATSAITGTVATATGGIAANARVIVVDSSKTGAASFVTTILTDANGAFSTVLPAGAYTLTAEGNNFLRSAPLAVTVPATANIALQLSSIGQLAYTVKDRQGTGIAAKISVIGAAASAPDARFRDIGSDSRPYGIAGFRLTFVGDSSSPNGFDAPIDLAPGTYRVVVTKGPEWSRFEKVVTITDAGARIDAVLDRIIPTPGYVAADFHQHTYFSPDSPIAPEDRVVAYLAEGVEFLSSSDHDTHNDYAPLLASLGVQAQLSSAVGVETTPWDYGHFIGFPLAFDADSPTGGALDWSAGESGANLSPTEIFAGLRALGAKVVQVNHPRSAPGDFSTFQKNFDRAALRFDFAGHTFYGDDSMQEFSATALGMPDGAKIFGAEFNALEIFNGFHAINDDSERRDTLVETNLRDWMNFLSFGFAPTPEGNSDSHSLYRDPSGVPRTMVRVPDDSAAAITAGLADAVVATMAGNGVPRDVVVSNTPFLQMTVDGAGIGSTVTHATSSAPIKIHLEVKTPAWGPIDTIEVFANETYDIPSATISPLMPALCFTTSATPTTRCQAAIGGARPLVLTSVEVVPGEAQTTRLEVALDVDVAIADLLARQRSGAQGQDLWFVARTYGHVGLYPLIGSGVDGTDLDKLVNDFNLDGIGQPALAFTNAIFVDVDGGGWRAPFAP